MRFSYFKTLSLPWQAHIICECGVRLAERSDQQVFVELYQIDSFYAEVHYQQSDNEIIKIVSFQDIDYLEPYISTISLKELTPKVLKGKNCWK